MNKSIIWLLLLLVGLSVLPTRTARADDGTVKDRLIIGENFTLSAGERIDGSLVVIAGETTIEKGAVVGGDVVVIAANLRLDGQTAGSAVVVGGSAALGPTSRVEGDLVALGGDFQRAEGAEISGDIITNLGITTTALPRAAATPRPELPVSPDYRLDLGPLGTAASILFQAIALGVVAVLLTAFLRPQLDRVAFAAQSQPFAAGSLGLLTLFLAPFAIAVMAITLILLPLALAAGFLLVLAWLFGVVALGQVVGEKMMEAMHRSWEPILATGLGAFVLGIVLGTSNQIPCVGWMASLIIGLIGLGAATMTIFGTREYSRVAAKAGDVDSLAQ